MPETDESNYSGRQTALLKQVEQQLGDAHSSHVLINNIHLASKGKMRVQQVRWRRLRWVTTWLSDSGLHY